MVSKIVLGIDGTCSMSVPIKQVLAILKSSLDELYDILKEVRAKKSFEIKIVVYRNYNSSKDQIIEETKFENKMDILQKFLQRVKVDGGYGNEALEMLYRNVNSEAGVTDLIILGDARANTKAETDWKMNKCGWTDPPIYADQ